MSGKVLDFKERAERICRTEPAIQICKRDIRLSLLMIGHQRRRIKALRKQIRKLEREGI